MSTSQGLNVGEAKPEGEVTASPQPGDAEAPVASFEEFSVSNGSPNANLARLPDEIVLFIIKHLRRASLKSLALTCANLRRIVLPDFYRSGKYKTFRLALRSGDLEMVKQCAEYGAAPVNGVWKVGFREDDRVKECECSTLFSHLVHRPIHFLTLGLDNDETTADQCLEVLQWLVDNDSDITAGSIDDRGWNTIEAKAQIEFVRRMKHMPCSFFHIFKMSTDREKLDGVAKIVCHLSSEGFNFPRLVRGVGSTLRSKEEYTEFTPLSYDSPFLVTMLMRSACPPSLLEAVLKQLKRQGVKLTCPRDSCPPQFKYGEPVDDHDGDFDPAPTILTQMWELVGELYNDLFDPQRWKPLYIGETSGGLDIGSDAKACWYELSMTFESFFDDDQLLDSQYRHPEDRMHRFALWVSWDPQKLWAQSLKKAPCGKLFKNRHRIDGPVNVMSDWPQEWRWADAGWLIDRDPDWCKIPLKEW
ncbi:F-box domain-containing protein [Fusarium keratoplasticum]|uniref:F-box domain-containing protein n=1 Tax=Fusarium keratoplasticum TaxID=1328300 RepID=A0ACC0RDE1_9HYPO|nr:F-box domain-containing protein [Fusarium keratoplasticum]KAI8683550.1 F-box domain-containing protein [Fusarium keratoplasticum]